jgi:hypothetical protein
LKGVLDGYFKYLHGCIIVQLYAITNIDSITDFNQ